MGSRRTRVAAFTFLLVLLVFGAAPVHAGSIEFRRGDVNVDGLVGIGDSVVLFRAFFFGEPVQCQEAADVNDDGVVDLVDPSYLLSYLFQDGPPPPPPGPDACGCDPLEEFGLGCANYPAICTPTPLERDPGFLLEFRTPEAIEGPPRAPVHFGVAVVLSNTQEVQAWSLAIRTSCPVVNATIEGTSIPERLVPGNNFHIERLVNDGELFGVVAATALDAGGNAVLEPGTHDVLNMQLEGAFPAAGCADCRLEFDDALPFGDRTVENIVTVAGRDLHPQIAAAQVGLCSTVRPLTLGEAAPFSLNPDDRVGHFAVPQFDPGDVGKVIVIQLAGLDPEDVNAVYARWGSLAGPTAFDVAADDRARSSQKLVLPFARQQDLFVEVRSNFFGGPQSELELQADLADLAVCEITPNHASSLGIASASIRGGGFDAGTSFSLVNEDTAETIVGAPIRFLGTDRVEVSFDLADAPSGGYTLEASRVGVATATFDGAFTVLDTRLGPRLEVKLGAPPLYRRNRLRSMTLRLCNTGDEEMSAPILKASGSPQVELRLGAGAPFQEELLVLGTDANGIQSKLAPGQCVEVPVDFQSGTSGILTLVAELLVADETDTIDWEKLSVPEGLSAAVWDQVRPQLMADLGNDWRSLSEALAELAPRVAARGQSPTSVTNLFRFAVRQALDLPAVAARGEVRDAAGVPVAGYHIMALVDATVRTSAVTDAQGRFALDWLEVGETYELRLEDHDVVGDVSLAVNEDTDVFGIQLVATPAVNGLEPACPDCAPEDLPEPVFVLPDEVLTRVAETAVNVVGAIDPNSKGGPVGTGPDGLLRPDEEMEYTVFFENVACTEEELACLADPTCVPRPNCGTTSALFVGVKDELELDFNLEAFQFREICVAGCLLRLDTADPAACVDGSSQSSSTEAYEVSALAEPPGVDYDIQVDARLDLNTRTVSWEMTTLDRATGDVVDDPDRGFLPVNDETGRGEGHMSFVINAATLPDAEVEGSEVENDADIEFDEEEAVTTPNVINPLTLSLNPGSPRNPRPADRTDRLTRRTSVLSWEGATLADSYEIFLWRSGETRPEEPTAVMDAPSYRPESPLEGGLYFWQVISVNRHGRTEGPVWSFRVTIPFVRGDVNDDGRIDLSDGIDLLNKLFGSAGEIVCLEAANVNGDRGADFKGKVDVSDPVFILNWLFVAGARVPPSPTPSTTSFYPPEDCGFQHLAPGLGVDVTADCRVFRSCE